MSVFALGLNHNSAPLDLRGKFAFSAEQLTPTLHGFQAQIQRGPAGAEAAILSTCNRTEVYVAGTAGMVQPAVDWLAKVGGVGANVLMDHAYVVEGSAAARHAFRVASGLDSMVLGEPQILGQMKQAVREADLAGTLGATLHQLFQRSFSVAKEVRSSTEIGAHSISMAAASVRLASQLFEDLGKIKVLFVGAGEMIELVATHFAAKTPLAMAVANRSVERGEKLASRFGAEAMRLADLPQRLHEFDAVISCTVSSRWFRVVVLIVTSPRSGREPEGRMASTSTRARSASPGRTGHCTWPRRPGETGSSCCWNPVMRLRWQSFRV